MEGKFKIGDIVRSNDLTGPPLIIIRVSPHRDVVCKYFNTVSQKYSEVSFPEECLTKIIEGGVLC